jgi:hypothetical protein
VRAVVREADLETGGQDETVIAGATHTRACRRASSDDR